MSGNVNPDHPRVDFAFCVIGGTEEVEHEEIARLIVELALQRDWELGPPVFLHELEDAEDVEGDDEPAEFLGGTMELYAMDPSRKLPTEIDRGQLEEVETVLAALQALSRRRGVDFEVWFNFEQIGSVNKGRLCVGLETGLLGPWREALEAEERAHSAGG